MELNARGDAMTSNGSGESAVMFVSPWTGYRRGVLRKTPPMHPHLGLAYLIASLKKNGITKVDVYDQGLEADDEVLYRRIERLRPRVIAVTTFSYSFALADSLVRELKQRTGIPVILGGPHVSAVRGSVLSASCADFAMYGESDLTFLSFLRELCGERRWEIVDNLIWRNTSGEITVNKPAPFIKDLDSLPFPDMGAFGFERYPYFKIKRMPLLTSRGCPYGCNYCSVKLSMGRTFRPRSPENVVAEIKHWKSVYGIRDFDINDDCFNLDMARAEAFCDLLIKEKVNITYVSHNGIRADRVNERLLQKMKASGCFAVNYGCESGSQEVLDVLGKSLRLEAVRNAVEMTTRAGIHNAVTFIIGHKGETLARARQSIEFAKGLKTNFVTFYNLVPYPGTDVYEWARQNARNMQAPEEYLVSKGYMDADPVFETDDFTRAERIEALNEGIALHRKTVLRYKFGRFLGSLLYLFVRNRTRFDLAARLYMILDQKRRWLLSRFKRRAS